MTMQKIMFNETYGLQHAVYDELKLMTRREPYFGVISKPNIGVYTEGKDKGRLALCDGERVIKKSRYRIGEVVAVAQSYETLANSGCLDKMMETSSTFKREYCGVGWSNKMFVRADLMPVKIRITNIKVERLQDISDDDCLKEGVIKHHQGSEEYSTFSLPNMPVIFGTAKAAFAALINKVNGKGTWKSNPWVFAYSFELVK